MKKFVLTLVAAVGLTVGLAGHATPAIAAPVGPSPCPGHPIDNGVYVDVFEDGAREFDTCWL
jgi:hypothetical protein